MHTLEQCKFINITPPAAVNDNSAFATATLDTIGFRECCFIIQFGAMDIAVAALKLTESDNSGMSNAEDVSGADFSLSPLTLPSASDDNHLFAIFVNLVKRKRYLDLSFTAGDGAVGTYATVLAILSRGEQIPATAADRGLTQQALV